jgi:hypothetical protein
MEPLPETGIARQVQLLDQARPGGGPGGLADLFFYGQEPGSPVGGFATVLILAVAASQPAVRKDLRARLAFRAATAFRRGFCAGQPVSC